MGDESKPNQINNECGLSEQAPTIVIETPGRARVITETFPPNEVYLSPPEVRTCTRVVQGLAPVQCVEKLQRHE